MQTISFRVQSPEEARTLLSIAKRAAAMAASHDINYSVLDAEMDVTACHVNGTRLKLNELLAADDANFAHDVFGIRVHLNRRTGQLEDCFLPRFSEAA